MGVQSDVKGHSQGPTDGAERFETVIIGGGQAGLSVGYHLAKRGRPFVILEANERIGDSWRNCWDSLRLFTPACYDGLEGLPFPAGDWSFPTKDEMADYLEAANVVWCTGYNPGFSWIDLPVFGEEGPIHERGIVGGEPGLYFVGLEFLYAMSSVMVHGVGRDAEHIAGHISSHVRAESAAG